MTSLPTPVVINVWSPAESLPIRYTGSPVPTGGVSGWTVVFVISKNEADSPLVSLTIGNGITVTDAARAIWDVVVTKAQIQNLMDNHGGGLFWGRLVRTDADPSGDVMARAEIYVRRAPIA